VNYAYKYLKMPENVSDIYDIIVRLARKLSGYRQHSDPHVTDNH
jgi:hypothetical protein